MLNSYFPQASFRQYFFPSFFEIPVYSFDISQGVDFPTEMQKLRKKWASYFTCGQSSASPCKSSSKDANDLKRAFLGNKNGFVINQNSVLHPEVPKCLWHVQSSEFSGSIDPASNLKLLLLGHYLHNKFAFKMLKFLLMIKSCLPVINPSH